MKKYKLYTICILNATPLMWTHFRAIFGTILNATKSLEKKCSDLLQTRKRKSQTLLYNCMNKSKLYVLTYKTLTFGYSTTFRGNIILIYICKH